jgi:2-polyprenyl-3-methyl-5-hydroxy-6-metoxy-1,4-benzoquinol methylase
MTDDGVDERFTKEHWDQRYGSSERVWSGKPNPQLVAETAHLDPGSALDAGCGEGADVHWLARRGWRVTGADVSDVALERAASHTDAGIADRITWVQVDLINWIPEHRYDLVSVQFMQLPRAVREPAFARLAAAVSPGGTLLIVGHNVSDLQSGAHRHGDPDMFFTAGEIAATLQGAQWRVHAEEARPRAAAGADGTTVTVHDAVLRAQRI